MPCDTISTTNVEFKMENTNVDLLQAALEGMGYTVNKKGNTLSFRGSGYNYVNGTFRDGKIDVEFNAWQSFDVNAVKRAYSTEVVRAMGKRFGWQLKEKAGTTNKVYEAVKRF